MSQAEEKGEAATTSNPMERTENVEAPEVEDETRATLNVMIVEAEDVGAIMTEGEAEILT